MRALGWIVAIGLTVYGGVLAVAGLLVEAGAIDAADDADEHAIAWHAYFWDPWFVLWGIAFTVAGRSRPQASEKGARYSSTHNPTSPGPGAPGMTPPCGRQRNERCSVLTVSTIQSSSDQPRSRRSLGVRRARGAPTRRRRLVPFHPGCQSVTVDEVIEEGAVAVLS